jgi:hypothetical protein
MNISEDSNLDRRKNTHSSLTQNVNPYWPKVLVLKSTITPPIASTFAPEHALLKFRGTLGSQSFLTELVKLARRLKRKLNLNGQVKK